MSDGSEPFCPRHGKPSSPVEIVGLRCDCRSNDKDKCIADLQKSIEWLNDQLQTKLSVKEMAVALAQSLAQLQDEMTDAQRKETFEIVLHDWCGLCGGFVGCCMCVPGRAVE